MTRQQKRLLDYLAVFIEKNGYSPSHEQMQEALGLKSKSGVHRIVNGLEAHGYITRLPYRSRSIELTCKKVDSKTFCSFLRDKNLEEDFISYVKAVRELAA